MAETVDANCNVLCLTTGVTRAQDVTSEALVTDSRTPATDPSSTDPPSLPVRTNRKRVYSLFSFADLPPVLSGSKGPYHEGEAHARRLLHARHSNDLDRSTKTGSEAEGPSSESQTIAGTFRCFLCKYVFLEHFVLPFPKPICAPCYLLAGGTIEGPSNNVSPAVEKDALNPKPISAQELNSDTFRLSVYKADLPIECIGCMHRFPTFQLLKATCEHYLCHNCLCRCVEASLGPDMHFPPNCCKLPLAFRIVADNVPAALFKRYRARQLEVQNATALYCAVPRCSARIAEHRINDLRANCQTCHRNTCPKCRNEIVADKSIKHICREDPDTQAVLAVAKREGWQTCWQCSNMVALNFGRFHMTCQCKAEFCYKCGIVWKKCSGCSTFDEHRVRERIQRALDLRAARRQHRNLQPADHRSIANQTAQLQQILLSHDCDHSYFYREPKSLANSRHCMVCAYDEGCIFIMHCENCTLTACRWCYNSLGRFDAVEASDRMELETADEAVARYQMRETSRCSYGTIIGGGRGNEAKRRRVEAADDSAGWVGVANGTDDADFFSPILSDPALPFGAFRRDSGSEDKDSLIALGAFKRKREGLSGE